MSCIASLWVIGSFQLCLPRPANVDRKDVSLVGHFLLFYILLFVQLFTESLFLGHSFKDLFQTFPLLNCTIKPNKLVVSLHVSFAVKS